MKVMNLSLLAMPMLVHQSHSFIRNTEDRNMQVTGNAGLYGEEVIGDQNEVNKVDEADHSIAPNSFKAQSSECCNCGECSCNCECDGNDCDCQCHCENPDCVCKCEGVNCDCGCDCDEDDDKEPEPTPPFSFQCALYEQLLSKGECYCGADRFGLCPDLDTCNEEAICDFCDALAGQSYSGDCPFCFETCSSSCVDYVKKCCPCQDVEIVRLDGLLYGPRKTPFTCGGFIAFNECGIPDIINRQPDDNNLEFFCRDLDNTDNFPSIDPYSDCVLQPECYRRFQQSIWRALSNAHNAKFLFGLGGAGLRVYCGGQAEFALFWKATPTYARYKGRVLKLGDGFYGGNTCGTVNYTCHRHDVNPYHNYNVAAKIETEENVDASHYSYPVAYQRDIIKDCCGWFISESYPQKYPPYSCEREWYRYDPHPISDKVGQIGEKATPCFTNLEWVGVLLGVSWDCYGYGPKDRELEQTETQHVVDEKGERPFKDFFIDGVFVFGKAPLQGCIDCCNEGICPIDVNFDIRQ